MLGAIAGDIIGSVYEHHRIKTTEFPLFQPHSRFTDDTVLTIAIASAILERADYAHPFKHLDGDTLMPDTEAPLLIGYSKTTLSPITVGAMGQRCECVRLAMPLTTWKGSTRGSAHRRSFPQ